MAADTNVEDILAIDSSLIPPGFTHGLQIAIPKSPTQLDDPFQQQPKNSQPRPLQQQQQQKFQQQSRQPPQQYQQRPQPQQFQRQQLQQSPQQQRQQPQQSQQQRPQQRPQTIPLQGLEQSDQLQVQQQSNLPQQQKQLQSSAATRKGNAFYSWVRKKLWCIRGNSPMEPNLSLEPSEGILKEGDAKTVTGEGSRATNVDLKKSVHNPHDSTAQMSTVARSSSISGKSVTNEIEGVKVKPKDRQVTFSDTVRTHIKTKYVTAEEYKQIRGMNAATGRIMYQIVKMRDGDDHPKDKINPFAGSATRCKRRKPI